jgi:glycosyltransferase involved in cell wall biosynthesis
MKKNKRKIDKKRLAKGKQVQKHMKDLQRFKIVAVFIAKNEEEALPRLMTSLKGFADRVVIVDTGSTDNTIEVAKQLGAEVHTMAWPDSFSVARNKAVELANCNDATWIVMFDADEVLEKGRELRWKLMKVHPALKVLSLRHRTKFGHNFPRNCIWRPGTASWMYRFHEHLIPNNFDRTICANLDHYVDHPDDIGKNHDNERILELMRMDAVEYPTQATRQYYYGRQLFFRQDDNCLEYFKKVFEMSEWPAEAAMATVYAGNLFEYKAKAFVEAGDQERAIEAKKIAYNFYRTAIAKYVGLRAAYVGVIRTAPNAYEAMVAAVAALKIPKSSFFDDPPKYYTEEAHNTFLGVINENKKVASEPQLSAAEIKVHTQDQPAVSLEDADWINQETESGSVSNTEAVS